MERSFTAVVSFHTRRTLTLVRIADSDASCADATRCIGASYKHTTHTKKYTNTALNVQKYYSEEVTDH